MLNKIKNKFKQWLFLEDEVEEQALELDSEESSKIVFTSNMPLPFDKKVEEMTSSLENTVNFKMITLENTEKPEEVKFSPTKTRDLLREPKYEFETIISPVYGKQGEKRDSIKHAGNTNIDKSVITNLSPISGIVNQKKEVPAFKKVEPTLDDFLRDLE